MHEKELSLTGKLDNGLTKGILHLLGWLKVGGLWLLGLTSLAALPWIIFEYEEGLSDLSILEWGFIPLLALLLWRHVHYCKHFTTGFWLGFSRLLICQGVMSALKFLLVGVVISGLFLIEHPQELFYSLVQESPLDKIITFSSVLVAAYLAAPTSCKKPVNVPAAAPLAAEPTASPEAKEALQ
ncbi:hypothetical protein [Halopseudomonas aestusnigri]|uniref:hypothetical protein n=1 Tax=Halopseudomonas aestusnigri TaxID=857252 RepID=UPI0028C05EB2|nr:hypothetical protein YSKK_30680 [Halopseudomonas aestusnigri]